MKKIPNLNKVRDGKRTYYNPTPDEKKVFYKVKKELERKYNIHLTSRDLIVKQLIATLTHGDYRNYYLQNIDLEVIRTDIKSFYPSINKHKLYKKISRANIISNSTLDLLKPMFFSKKVRGIPLGLPFSSILAEIYLEYFDRDIYSEFSPTYYFRYVDDLIIIRYAPIKFSDYEYEKNEMKKKLKKVFSIHSLTLNDGKTDYTRDNSIDNLKFSYLGYDFNAEEIKSNKNKKNKEKKLVISINEDKLTKIINKIKQDFYYFKKSNRSKRQFWILYYKLKNSFYGITSLDKNNKKIYFGLGYSYRFVNNEQQLIKLINSIKGLIFSCKLSSYQTATLLSLLTYNNSALEILRKRYDYTSLTEKQLNKMKKRLSLTTKSNNISRLFYIIYNK